MDTPVTQQTREQIVPTASLASKKVITLLALAVRPDGSKSVFRIHKDRITLGSVISADVRLTGAGVSPIHAVLELSAQGDGVIYDLASESGVFVNGERVVTQRISAGDKIKIAAQEFQFNIEELDELVLQERTRETEGRKLFLDASEDFSPLILEDERDITPIFDYRPTQLRALEVVMSWFGTILDVEHFVKEKSITLGTGRRSDFEIPPLLTKKHYAIVTRRGSDFTLNLDPQMRGVLQRKSSLMSLDEVRSEVRAAPGAIAEVPLNEGDFAKVSVGDVDFYLNFTAAPPRLKMGRLLEKDPLFIRVFLGSVIMSVAVVAGLVSTYQPHPIEAEEIPERLATILYQPEKFIAKKKDLTLTAVSKSTEQPSAHAEPKALPTVQVDVKPQPMDAKKPIPKEIKVAPQSSHLPKHPTKTAQKGGGARRQSEAKEGEGARAKGVQGSRGEKNAHPGPEHQTLAQRTSAQGGVGQGGGKSQVEDVGNVDILKSATGKIQDILGNTADKLGKGGEKLKGFGGFTTEGAGGLALSGSGSGGGGDADSLGGLGKKGNGGGRVGTGKGAAGSGNGFIGGRARVALRTGGPEETVVMGSIDADAIAAAIAAHRDEFRKCYEQEIRHDAPARGGRVGTNFVIGSTGRVTHAVVESTTLNIQGTESCILDVIRRIDFPIPRGAGVVQVSFPFKFNPVGNK